MTTAAKKASCGLTRLRYWSEFKSVMECGASAKTAHFVFYQSQRTNLNVQTLEHVQANDQQKIGALTPKKWARRSVTRNMIRRQVFEVFRTQTNQFSSAACVIRLSRPFDANEYISGSSRVLKSNVRKELEELFAKARSR